MKLVELLAKELAEWPENVVVYFQWGNGEVFATSKGFPTEYNDGMWYVVGSDIEMAYNAPMYDKKLDLADDHDTANVNRAQWQAERDRQKGGEWKRHRGGKCPVKAGTKVSTRHRDGKVFGVHFQTAEYGTHQNVMDVVWKHTGDEHDIMAYRVISQPQAEEVEVKDTTIGTLRYKVEIDTTEASQAIDDLTAKWDQIETPFKWRDEVTELNAYIEKYTRERDAIIERLASEGFALIPPVVSVVSEFSGVDMSDWRNWKRGDVIEMIADDWCDLSRDERYTIISTNDNSFTIIDDCDDKRELSVDEETVFSCGRIPDFKFIKRG